MYIVSSLFKSTFPSANPAGEARGVIFEALTPSIKGIVIIHDRSGLSDQMAVIGCQVAREGGFTVLMLDLYRGKVPRNEKLAARMMDNLDLDGALKDIHAAIKHLYQKGCKRVGVMGFSMGGALAFQAASLPHVSAIAPFYGIPRDQRSLFNIKIPVQAHFGKKDDVRGFSSPEDYSPLREKMLGSGVDLDVHTYDAGHGFANPTSEHYNEKATEEAMGAVFRFFKKNLA